jgi:CrcB protein
MSIYVWAGVAAVGGVGAIGRFLLDTSITARLASDFPWGTFAVNISGSFVLGILAGAALSGNWLVIAGTATVGAYTTFSTWMFETNRLGEQDDRLILIANVLGSLAAGLLAVYLGQKVGQQL